MSFNITKLTAAEAKKIAETARKSKGVDPAIAAAVQGAKPGEAFRVTLGDWNPNRAKRHFCAAAKAASLAVNFPPSGETGVLLVALSAPKAEPTAEPAGKASNS